jgi:hypothetical protein
VIRREQGVRYPAKLGSSRGSEANHMRFGIGQLPSDKLLDCRWLRGDVAVCVQQSGQVRAWLPARRCSSWRPAAAALTACPSRLLQS